MRIINQYSKDAVNRIIPVSQGESNVRTGSDKTESLTP